MGRKLEKVLDFQIDDYLNPYIPAPRLDRLPTPISHFLGYRSDSKPEPKDVPHLLVCFWAFIGAFLGLLVVGAMYKYAPGLASHNPPVLIASLVRPPISQFFLSLLLLLLLLLFSSLPLSCCPS